MWLCDVTWEDGSLRLPSKLSIWTGDSLWKLSFFDPTAKLIAFLSNQDPSALLMSLEKGLKADQLDWRRSVDFDKRKTSRR
jgi:hypothetical protein